VRVPRRPSLKVRRPTCCRGITILVINAALVRVDRAARRAVRPRDARTGDEGCAVKGESTQPVRVRSKEVSVRLGSYPGDGEGD